MRVINFVLNYLGFYTTIEMNYDQCPNCGKSLNGFMSADLLPQSKVDFINKHLNESK